jgi:hypothetical protein
MKTDELVALLAAQAQPVPRHAARRLLALAVVAALPFSFALMLAGYGLRPGLAASLVQQPMALIKLLAPVAMAVAGFVAVERLARPGVPLRRAAWGVVLPVLLLWVLGALAWLAAAPAERPELLWGHTWRTCALSISLMAAPVFVASLLALRSAAPTRPALAGAAAGALGAGSGAAVYALHCPELMAPFLAVWYVLGMAIPVAVGALLGKRVLRW